MKEPNNLENCRKGGSEKRGFCPNTRDLSQPNLFEKWVLNLDKYIDFQYYKKVKPYGFITGMFVFILFLWVAVSLRLPSKFVTTVLLAMFPLGFGFVQANQFGWRIRRQLNQIGTYDCGCNQKELTLLGQDKWVMTRLHAHYTCTIYIFICFFFLGWFLATFLGIAIYFINA